MTKSLKEFGYESNWTQTTGFIRPLIVVAVFDLMYTLACVYNANLKIFMLSPKGLEH